MLQAVTRHGLSEQEKTSSLETVLSRIWASLPDPAWNEAGWRLWERLAPHVRAMLGQAQGGPTEPAAAWIMNQYGLWLAERAQYAQAEPLYRRALAIWEKSLGSEHRDVATSLHNLAALCGNQGRYPEAEPLMRRALTIWEKALGPEHRDVATSLHNLAALYRVQGRYPEAEPLMHRALAIWEKALGPDHPNLVTCLENYALLLRAVGCPEEAATLEARSRAIRAKRA